MCIQSLSPVSTTAGIIDYEIKAVLDVLQSELSWDVYLLYIHKSPLFVFHKEYVLSSIA